MRVDAIAVSSKDFKKSVEFYQLLGFTFDENQDLNSDHIEATDKDGMRLLFDRVKLHKEMSGHEPTPANHSNFALLCDSVDEVNQIAEKIKNEGFKITKEPWDAFWGQRYCIVEDPDGYKIDLFAELSQI